MNWPLVRYDVGSSEKWGPQIILCESACSLISIIVLRWYQTSKSCNRSGITDRRSSHCWLGSGDCAIIAAWAWRLDRWNVWGNGKSSILKNFSILVYSQFKNSFNGNLHFAYLSMDVCFAVIFIRLGGQWWLINKWMSCQGMMCWCISLELPFLHFLADSHNSRNSGWNWWGSWYYGLISYRQQVKHFFITGLVWTTVQNEQQLLLNQIEIWLFRNRPQFLSVYQMLWGTF